LNSRRIYLCTIFLLLAGKTFSQSVPVPTSNLREKFITTRINPTHFDSISVIPGTVSIVGVPENLYNIDFINGTVYWKSRLSPDSVLITYRVFPFRFNEVTRRYNFDSIRFNFNSERPFILKSDQELNNKIFNFGNMEYNGSIGRGISFGNSQDAVVNSSLNLQLNGYIGDSLLLSAAISDNNIPIQPQGNTQNINDFDKILLQIGKRGWQASFGDIDIRQDQNYFLKFSSRLQGASFRSVNPINKNTTNSLLVSGAIAKGKFTRDEITPIDGNQGPYRLSGANGELVFTILAATEKVFIDGQLMTRGADQDYVIDYNTAEITFTAKRPITKDSRIQVEFEYTDRNYLNSQVYANDEISVNKKFKVNVAVYSNVDAKNTSINQNLDVNQKEFLSQIGNRVDSAYYPDDVLDTFSASKILYKKIDTVFNGTHDSIFVYSVNPGDTLYNLGFTNVPQGKGDYIQASSNANGQVYMWVQPVNGVSQGNYAPVVLLVAPKKQQLISTSAQYFLNDKSYIKGEIAFSNYDVNTFSLLDKGGDHGAAAKFEYYGENRVFKNSEKTYLLQSGVNYEYVQDHFTPIERLRDVEFNRDWSLPFTAPAATENLISGTLQLKDAKNNYLKYELTNYNRSDDYEGIRNSLDHMMQFKGWRIADKFDISNIQYGDQKGTYFRPTLDISKMMTGLDHLTIGAGYSAENNKQLDQVADTITSISYSFDTWQIYLKSNQKKLNKWGITYVERTNRIPFQKNFINQDKSRNLTLTTELMSNKNRQLRMNLTYHALDVINPGPGNEQSDKGLLGRMEYNMREWKGFLRGNMLYELGSGQEQKRQITYVQVPAGQGNYTWIDYNHDGIPQLNEFEPAVYADQGDYIMVYTPTDQYVKANYLTFNYVLSLDPSAFMPKKIDFDHTRFWGRFSSSSSLQINKKNVAQNGNFEFNPFTRQLVDSNLITLSSFLSNTLYFNRKSIKWGIDITHRINTTKALLDYGFQSNKLRDITIKSRWNLNHSIATTLTNKFALNQLITPAFSNRNYLIKEVSVEPSVSYVHKSNFRVSLIYTYDNKYNTINFMEKALNNVLAVEVRYNVLSDGTLSGRLSLNNIDFNPGSGGSATSTTGYVLLNGLAPGDNYLWNIQLTKRLAGNIELNLQYDGRRPAGSKVVNTGTATVRAIF
jgi:hypothetical protein